MQLIASFALLVACSGPSPGSIAYVSERDGGPAVHVVEADGTGDRVVAEGGRAWFPASPDPRGSELLLISSEESPAGHREALALVGVGGGAPREIAPAAGAIRNPAWSPDGGSVVFESDAASYRDLFRVARDGTGLTRLTDAKYGSFEPTFSPDGASIAFGTSRDGNAEIYAMNADGSGQRRITNDPTDDVHPSFGADGTLAWLAFRGGHERVWLCRADGSDQRPLQPGTEDETDFAWSPEELAVVVQVGPKDLDIDVVDVATGHRLARLGGAGVDEHPAWSPDGKWIAWNADSGGGPDIEIARADGSDRHAVVAGPAAEWLPRWLAR